MFTVTDDILDVTATSDELGKTAGKDQKSGKTTYVSLLGIEESKIQAGRYCCLAKQALSNYGQCAERLLSIADFVLARKS